MLICVQKINFIAQFFLKILQRNSKLVILGNLGMPGHTSKMIIAIWRNLWPLSVGKSSSSSFTFSLRYSKDNVNFFGGYFGHAWLLKPKEILQLVENFHAHLLAKNQLRPHAFLEILQRYANYVGYFGNAWLHTPKMIASTCRRLWCLSACQNKLYHSLLFWDITF